MAACQSLLEICKVRDRHPNGSLALHLKDLTFTPEVVEPSPAPAPVAKPRAKSAATARPKAKAPVPSKLPSQSSTQPLLEPRIFKAMALQVPGIKKKGRSGSRKRKARGQTYGQQDGFEEDKWGLRGQAAHAEHNRTWRLSKKPAARLSKKPAAASS